MLCIDDIQPLRVWWYTLSSKVIKVASLFAFSSKIQIVQFMGYRSIIDSLKKILIFNGLCEIINSLIIQNLTRCTHFLWGGTLYQNRYLHTYWKHRFDTIIKPVMDNKSKIYWNYQNYKNAIICKNFSLRLTRIAIFSIIKVQELAKILVRREKYDC